MLAARFSVQGSPWTCWKARKVPRRRVARAEGPARGDGGEEEEEANRLQEVLVELLRAETLKAKMKDALERYTEEEEQKLRELVQEAHEEFDKLDELNKQRTQLEFGSALADIERTASEVEEQIRKSRAESRKDGQDLEDFEKNMEDQLMTGLFFKSIHRSTKDPKSEAVRRATNDVRKRVEEATDRSIDSFVLRWIAYLFLTVLAGVPLVASVAREDVPGAVPALYTCVLFLMSLQMRKELDKLEKDKEK